MDHMSFTAVEQDWAKARADKSPRHQEWVKVKNGTRDQAWARWKDLLKKL